MAFPIIPIQIPNQFPLGCGQFTLNSSSWLKKKLHKCPLLFQECLICVIVQYSLAWLLLDKYFSSNPVIKDWSLCFCLSASVSVCLSHSRGMVCAHPPQELKRDTDSSDRGLEVIFPVPHSLALFCHIKRVRAALQLHLEVILTS